MRTNAESLPSGHVHAADGFEPWFHWADSAEAGVSAHWEKGIVYERVKTMDEAGSSHGGSQLAHGFCLRSE
ncbi:hypothetical protein SCARR_05560 [Pontiella sulfatireligans]|uniref:Uncharacterized protein n=1 Tax=Pontiella sulfatireligans TaxID=2750658 RepID=A0A6C2UU14_9BACT|nr:hypothetical protein SCARR_05560 [Pontiella sulfatireligans]